MYKLKNLVFKRYAKTTTAAPESDSENNLERFDRISDYHHERNVSTFF